MYVPSSKIKKIFKTVIFSAIFALTFAFLSHGFIPSGSENEDGMESRISKAYRGEPKDTIDIMFIGNSDIYRGISPVDLYHSTGITSAIAGEPGKKFSKVNTDLKDILKYQKPKVVVLETDCMFSEKKALPAGSESKSLPSPSQRAKNFFSKCMNMAKKVIHYVKQGDNAVIAAINYKYPLIKYHDNYSSLRLSDFFDPLRKYSFFNKGMAYSDKVKSYEGGKSYMKNNQKSSPVIDSDTENKFKAIIDTCNENDIQLVLTTIPSANTWSDDKHTIIQNLADKYKLEYYDYNTDFPNGFDWLTDSTDGGNHLNYSGAKKVTDDISRKFVDKIGLNPSEISKGDKERWENDYKSFHEKIVRHESKNK